MTPEKAKELEDRHRHMVWNDDKHFKTTTCRVVMEIEPTTRKIKRIDVFTLRVLKDPRKPPPGYSYDGFKGGRNQWKVFFNENGPGKISVQAMRMAFFSEIFKTDPVSLKDKREVSHLHHRPDCWDYKQQAFESTMDNQGREGGAWPDLAAAKGSRPNVRPGPSAFKLGYRLLEAPEGATVNSILPSAYDNDEDVSDED
jgi:hypothetical protein